MCVLTLKATHNHIDGQTRLQQSQGERQQQVHHVDASPTNAVTLATIHMICFIAEHNLPFTLSDHMVELCKVMFSDSAIAQSMCMKKNKMY